MKVSTSGLIGSTGLIAIAAALLFVLIQPLHPAEVHASVITDAWAIVHMITLVMVVLFLVGITGIYATHAKRLGWLGLLGFVVLFTGLLITAALDVVEAFVLPLMAEADPDFVNGFLAMVAGHPTSADLGAFPLLWNAHSLAFLAGTLLFGAAIFRARVLSRWAAAIFALGSLVAAPVAQALGAPRLAAVPVGIGLAWLGYSLWSQRRKAEPSEAAETPLAHAGGVAVS
jgi:hypothetical protein